MRREGEAVISQPDQRAAQAALIVFLPAAALLKRKLTSREPLGGGLEPGLNASGAVSSKTVVLLTPVKMDAAAKKILEYRALGR